MGSAGHSWKGLAMGKAMYVPVSHGCGHLSLLPLRAAGDVHFSGSLVPPLKDPSGLTDSSEMDRETTGGFRKASGAPTAQPHSENWSWRQTLLVTFLLVAFQGNVLFKPRAAEGSRPPGPITPLGPSEFLT